MGPSLLVGVTVIGSVDARCSWPSTPEDREGRSIVLRLALTQAGLVMIVLGVIVGVTPDNEVSTKPTTLTASCGSPWAPNGTEHMERDQRGRHGGTADFADDCSARLGDLGPLSVWLIVAGTLLGSLSALAATAAIRHRSAATGPRRRQAP
jgi:hypothetical protein